MASAVVMGLVAFCAGCTMCCHPYDYCGPVYDNCGQCGSGARAGSILPLNTKHSLLVAGDQKGMEVAAPSVEQESPTVDEYEGASQILSVTDRKVEDSQVSEKSPAANNKSEPILAQPAQVKRR